MERKKVIKDQLLEEVSLEDSRTQDIQDVIKQSFLDEAYTSKWLPIKVEYVHNTSLEEKYQEKKQALLVKGRKPPELAESYGFIVENDVNTLTNICMNSLRAQESAYNVLGNSQAGVYVCKHADVCLQHCLQQDTTASVLRLLIFKYIQGRCTTAVPRVASVQELIKPTVGYDSHVSVLTALPNEDIQEQFNKSQVYLFEVNKLLQPECHPRQILPYAVVTYTPAGQPLPTVTTAMTSVNVTEAKLADNPQLQQIINAINAKPIEESPVKRKLPVKVKTSVAEPMSILGEPQSLLGEPCSLLGQHPGIESRSANPRVLVNGESRLPMVTNGGILMEGNSPVDGATHVLLPGNKLQHDIGSEPQMIPTITSSSATRGLSLNVNPRIKDLVNSINAKPWANIRSKNVPTAGHVTRTPSQPSMLSSTGSSSPLPSPTISNKSDYSSDSDTLNNARLPGKIMRPADATGMPITHIHTPNLVQNPMSYEAAAMAAHRGLSMVDYMHSAQHAVQPSAQLAAYPNNGAYKLINIPATTTRYSTPVPFAAHPHSNPMNHLLTNQNGYHPQGHMTYAPHPLTLQPNVHPSLALNALTASNAKAITPCFNNQNMLSSVNGHYLNKCLIKAPLTSAIGGATGQQTLTAIPNTLQLTNGMQPYPGLYPATVVNGKRLHQGYPEQTNGLVKRMRTF